MKNKWRNKERPTTAQGEQSNVIKAAGSPADCPLLAGEGFDLDHPAWSVTFCGFMAGFTEKKKENTLRRGTRGLDQPLLYGITLFILWPMRKKYAAFSFSTRRRFPPKSGRNPPSQSEPRMSG